MTDQRIGRRVTLKTVADAVGVNKSTVSRLLSEDPRLTVTQETRDRILREVERLGYRPNPIARGLRTARSASIGIITGMLDNPVHAEIIYSVEAAATESGYSLIVSHAGTAQGSLGKNVRRLVDAHRVDGLLLVTFQDESALKDLEEIDVPFVIVNREGTGSENWVALDDEHAAQIAVSELAALGHTDIAHIAGPPGRYNAGRRLQGYRRGLREAGLAFRDDLVVDSDYSAEGGRRAVGALLESGVPFTAIVAVTLATAAGAMAALHEAGIDIPSAVSIVAIHDGALATLLYPPLSTVRLDVEAMGRCATESLIGMIEGKRDTVEMMIEGGTFVPRGSTERPRAAFRGNE